MAIGAEVSFFVVLGFVVLGPKRMQTVLQKLGALKHDFTQMSNTIKSQVTAELHAGEHTGAPRETGK